MSRKLLVSVEDLERANADMKEWKERCRTLVGSIAFMTKALDMALDGIALSEPTRKELSNIMEHCAHITGAL